jgi:hypothetical protein
MSVRFSILGLIGLVTFAAVACQTLMHPGSWWASILITATLAAIGIQSLRVLLLAGQRRASSLGWLLFAVAYLAVTTGPWLADTFGRQMITTHGLAYAQNRWPNNNVQVQGGAWFNVNGRALQFIDSTSSTIWIDNGLGYSGFVPAGNAAAIYPSQGALIHPFQVAGHWLFAWIAGAIGAAIGGHFYRRSAASKH